MQISSVQAANYQTQQVRSGNQLPISTTNATQSSVEIIQQFDLENLSWGESQYIADTLIKSGEGRLSLAFLPPPAIRINEDGSVTSFTNEPEAQAILSQRFNIFEHFEGVIEARQQDGLPTDLQEDALSFLETLSLSQTSPRINTYT